MFRLATPCRGVNFVRYFVVRLTASKKCQYQISKNSIVRVSAKFYSDQKKNSSDSRIRDFCEYPDVNTDEDDVETPYTNWEGVENRYAHSILEKNKSYSTTIPTKSVSTKPLLSGTELDDLLQKNFRFETIYDLVYNFRLISHYAQANDENIHDKKYENILNSIESNSNILSDNQICHVLRSLALWFIETNEEDSSFSKLCISLDKACKYRSNLWSIEKVLYVSDHWYKLRLIRKSSFMIHAIGRMGKNPEKLSPRHIVQLMFYSSVLRRNLVNFTAIESQLKSNINYLDIDEIALVALGFFKTQTMIRDRGLLAIIIQRTIKEIESINEISLAAILKIVRYSIHIDDLGFLCKLLENTIPQVPRLSVKCLVHILLAAANRSLFYAELLNAIATRFYREITKIRVKDIRCLVFALSSFNYVPEKQPNIFDRVIEELNDSNRQDELKRHPQCLVTCLHHLSILKIHPKNLIAQALDPKSIERMYGSNANTIRREIFALDLDIEAEIPDYQGPRLNTKTRENVAMRQTQLAPWSKTSQLTVADYFMLDVIRACEEYLGSKEMVHVDHVLPQYYRPDIIICFDKTNNPIPMSSILSKLPFGSVKHPLKISTDDITWLALVMGTHNSYAKNTKRMLGHLCAKHRQLEHIGYTPSVIFWQDWKLFKSDAEKFKYLQYKVFS